MALRRPALTAVALAAALLAANARPADACSIPPNAVHTSDPAYIDDHTPPRAPVVGAITVKRTGMELECDRCGSPAGRLEIELKADDDAARDVPLGYTFVSTDRNGPAGFVLSYGPLRAYDGIVFFHVREDEDVAFDLEIRAVDLNGNIGPPTIVRYREDEGGCRTSRSRPWSVVPVVLAILGVTLRRRRK